MIQGDHNQDGEAGGWIGGHWHWHPRMATLPTEDYEPFPTGQYIEISLKWSKKSIIVKVTIME